MMFYGSVLFLSAFLLFLIQPLIGKVLLPWFGGTAAVWTTCMLFFQAVLLAGYGYAHVLTRCLRLRRQVLLHALLLSLSAALVLIFSIFPPAAAIPADSRSPVWEILFLLAASIGIPYFLLSTTAPLAQFWFSRSHPGASPYRLYALSNLGSLLAIAAYPFAIEPAMRLRQQGNSWAWAFGLYAALCIGLCRRLSNLTSNARDTAQGIPGDPPEDFCGAPRPRAFSYGLWLSLSACSSLLLLATTNQLCQDVAVVPMLWILPLALYLLSFIICFQCERIYQRPLFLCGLAGALAWTCFVLAGNVFVALRWQVLSYSLTLFMGCMVCSGEMVRSKPEPRFLTSFYLMISAGGALGGILATIVAPLVLKDYWEYHAGLLATAVLALVILFKDSKSCLYHGKLIAVWIVLLGLVASLAAALGMQIRQSMANSLETRRNFFGVLRVLDFNQQDASKHRYTLMHGRIEHGFQFLDEEKRYWPTSYYGPESGVGLAICFHPKRIARTGGLRIGVIGLGTGTLAAYGEQADSFRFYEINPEVLRLSDQYFTYRKNSPARIETILGDARISLEREKAQNQPQHFDVLAVDAFSSDAIPVHLLTRECYETYRYHLNEDGILAVHISNRYFDLGPVARNLIDPAQSGNWRALDFSNTSNDFQGTDASDWVLITSNRQFLDMPEIQLRVLPWPDGGQSGIYWTDDTSDLLHVLRK